MRSIPIGALAFAALAFAACTKKPYGSGPRSFQIPWPSATGEYSLQAVTIETFHEPEKLRGQLVTVVVNPDLKQGRLEGKEANGRFIKAADGVWVPSDLLTLQATTVYAHLERLFEIDRRAGAVDVVTWPVGVGIDVRFDGGTFAKNNAFYDGALDALLIVPYHGKDLPISMNGGVLAHEHFHAIFHRLIVRPVLEKHGEAVANGVFLDGGGLGHWAELHDEGHGEDDKDEAVESDASEDGAGGADRDEAGGADVSANRELSEGDEGESGAKKGQKPAPGKEHGKKEKDEKGEGEKTKEEKGKGGNDKGERRPDKPGKKEKPVPEPDEDVPAREFNVFMLRALNEGLADFWGWVYTGDAEFISRSLKKSGEIRRLDQKSGQVPTAETLKSNLAFLKKAESRRARGAAPARLAFAYSIGSVYARFMRALAIELADGDASYEKRVEAAGLLLRSLEELRQPYENGAVSEYVSPDLILNAALNQIEKPSQGACDLFVEAVSSYDKEKVPAACRALRTDDAAE